MIRAHKQVLIAIRAYEQVFSTTEVCSESLQESHVHKKLVLLETTNETTPTPTPIQIMFDPLHLRFYFPKMKISLNIQKVFMITIVNMYF